MADPIETIKNAINTELAGHIQTAITPFVSQEQGTFVGGGDKNITWTVEDNANNTYTYQPKQKEMVPGYRKKNGTYVDRYQRQVAPITVEIDEEKVPAGVDAAIQQGIGMLVANLQSRI